MKLPAYPTVPDLSVDTVGHGRWRLADSRGRHSTLVVFYRGLRSAMCRANLSELASLRSELARLGVDSVAVSCDDAARARRTVAEWNLRALRVGYGVAAPTARAWGVHVDTIARAEGETDAVAEPAVFLVRPDLTLRFASVQTTPLIRLHFVDIVAALGAGDVQSTLAVDRISAVDIEAPIGPRCERGARRAFEGAGALAA